MDGRMTNRRGTPVGTATPTAPGHAGRIRERVGLPLSLLLVWLWFEFGRPPNPLSIPLLLSIAMFGGWLLRTDKRWSRQHSLFVALLTLIVVSVPMAANTFSAYVAAFGMAVTILTVCVPMPSLVTSVRKVRAWAYTFVAVSLLVGGWALFHGGVGPSASSGGQDENYVAAMMCMAIPFAYFSIFGETRRRVRLLLILSVVVFTGAIIVGFSRGGFVGLCAVALYCLARSPKKLVGASVVAVIVIAALLFAGSDYWKEMGTITDTSEDTADLRIEIWKIGLRMWASNPVLGVGPGNFRWQVGDYQSAEQTEKYGRSLQGSIIAHSLPVELLAELGTVGAIVVVALLWGTWRNLRRIQREIPRPRRSTDVNGLWPLSCYADAVIGSIIGCLATGMFLSLLYFSYLWLLIALGSAITQVFHSQGVEPSVLKTDGPTTRATR
jgi:O-antigen ligase